MTSGHKDDENRSFPVSAGVDSFTYKTTAQKEKWLGNGPDFVLVDTPGRTLLFGF